MIQAKKGPSIFGKLNLGTDSPESWNREKASKKYRQESFEQFLSRSRESGKRDAEREQSGEQVVPGDCRNWACTATEQRAAGVGLRCVAV